MDDERAKCPGCTVFLKEPYIHCAECSDPPVDLCLECFRQGMEMGQHQSDHRYEVVKNDFQLFDRGWTAAEEVRLLQAISDCGIDNWADISQQIRTKTKEQCRIHYQKCYLENPHESLPVLEARELHHFPNPVPFTVSDDPPRPAENSALFMEMSGYNAPRGDFVTEHDNFAECMLRDVAFQEGESEVERDLKLAVVDVYNRVLRERHRRKKLIRDHGLIHVRKQKLYHRMYERVVGMRLEDSLIKFCRLVTPEQWDELLIGLKCVQDLQRRIERLLEWRGNGIQYLRCGRVYEELLSRRRHARTQRLHLMDQLEAHIKDERTCAAWLSKHKENMIRGRMPTDSRRVAPPLDIIGMPGYDKLNDDEKKLCSTARIVPASFLEYKQVLIKDATNNGHLKLAQARTLIKIDVNKTRKIFDYLVNNGYINKA